MVGQFLAWFIGQQQIQGTADDVSAQKIFLQATF
jgi:hypothetical protein